MIVPEPRPADPEPRPPFQFTLRTLLLLFVVLGSSLAVFGGWGIVVSALVVGLAIYIRYVQSLPSPGQCFLLLVVLLGALLALLTPVVETARESSLRLQCAVNLKQIAAALLAYHQAHGSFPPAYIADKSGKPMHSWRALILPFLDSNPIAGAYDFSEPWDGPNNKKLLALRHPFYVCPGAADARTPSASQTSYVAVVGPGTAWAGEKSRKAGDFGGADGDTILVVELINSGIAWSEPKDLSLDSLGAGKADSSVLILSSDHSQAQDFFFAYDRQGCGGVNVAMADGHVRYLPLGGLPKERLRNILQIGGCKDEAIDWEGGLFQPERQRERYPNWPNIAALLVWLLSAGTLLVGAVRGRKAAAERPA